MDSHDSIRTGGTNDLTGYYLSMCCRGELLLERGEKNPCCPVCEKPTEWVITLRPVWKEKPRPSADLRRSKRITVPPGIPHVCHLQWNGAAVVDARVLNFSPRGMAVEISRPAPIRSTVILRPVEGSLIPGEVRHCRPRGGMYVMGIVFAKEFQSPVETLNALDSPPSPA